MFKVAVRFSLQARHALNIPFPKPKFFHSHSTPLRRNLLKKYERPPLSSPAPISLASDTGPSDIVSETLATEPVIPSIQTTPNPSAPTSPIELPRTPTPIPIEDSRQWVENIRAKDEAKVILGVKIPEKPRKPGDDECCMSGCVHCVYNVYADEITTYHEALRSAALALQAAHVPSDQWDIAVKEEFDAGGATGESMAEEKVKDAMEDAYKGMDSGMRAFLEMERKMKQKKTA